MWYVSVTEIILNNCIQHFFYMSKTQLESLVYARTGSIFKWDTMHLIPSATVVEIALW